MLWLGLLGCCDLLRLIDGFVLIAFGGCGGVYCHS